jgi:group I intron endonuclease
MENQGEIYCIKSPSGKMYVGQCVKILSSGKKWGYISRWKDHIRDSNGKNCCRLLNNSIRKYGSENFSIEILKECPIDELNYYENYYIELLNTISPNGYNLTLGGSSGRNSQETINLKRINMIGKNLGKVYPKRIRKREEDLSLPKYLRYYKDSSGKEGYRISHHPFLKDKSFFGKTISLEEKLNSALNYLNTADIRLRFNE